MSFAQSKTGVIAGRFPYSPCSLFMWLRLLCKNGSSRRVFFRVAAQQSLDIHKVCLRSCYLLRKKIPRRARSIFPLRASAVDVMILSWIFCPSTAQQTLDIHKVCLRICYLSCDKISRPHLSNFPLRASAVNVVYHWGLFYHCR